MPILSEDIKLLASERLTDNDDGGGRITGNEIVDGQSNNLFSDISDLDRTYGRVSLRKAFVGVRTDDVAVYFGSHLIAQEIPADPNVSVTLFSTDDPADERAAARDRVESYVVMGPESRMRLLEDQLIGQRSITVYQAVDAELPEVGDVYVLSTESGAHDGEVQYVRINAVDSTVRTFVDGNGPFQEAVLTLQIGDPLRFRFYGQSAQRQTGIKPPTRFRQTTVANAAQYFGTVSLAAAGALGDVTLQVASIYSQLVPSAQANTPLTDVPAAGDREIPIAAGAARTLNFDFGDGVSTRYLDGPIAIGTLSIDNGAVTDDAGGNLIKAGNAVGAVDYTKGTITPAASANLNGQHSVTYTPAAAVQAQTFSQKTDITLGNRSNVYVLNLQPIPAPGTLVLDYRALGKWYRLRDNGKGEIVGDLDNTGTGRIDFTTGSVTVTLAALPDVGTALLAFWNIAHRYEIAAGLADIDYVISHALGSNCDPSSVVVTWESGGATKTATADAGVFSGDGTGRVTAAGDLSLTPAVLPAPGSDITVTFNVSDEQTQNITATNGAIAATLSGPVRPGTLSLTINSDDSTQVLDNPPAGATPVFPFVPTTRAFAIYDDGQGNVLQKTADWGPQTIGTIDYATGEISAQMVSLTVAVRVWCKTGVEGFGQPTYDYLDGTVTYPAPANQTQAGHYVQDASTSTQQTVTFPAPALTLDKLPIGDAPFVPTSLLFTFGGATYIDREGKLYRNVDPATGAGIESGSIDYTARTITLDYYVDGASGFTVLGLLLQYDQAAVGATSLRTSGAPVQPGSFFVRANTAAGDLISATADGNGDLNANGITGHIDVETGVVDLAFTPEVLPDTIFYNCVIFTFLPLDADILGLDPVRLPQDGRVPVFQPGYVAVVHNTQRVAEAALAAGQVLDAGRVRLAYAAIEDADGTLLDPALYTADFDAGTLTMNDPLDLSAYTAPFTFVHRIEDMAIVTDVQVSGFVTLQRALSHDFSAGDTLVSSALIAGDLQGRFTDLFDQKTWTGVFSDDRIGDESSAEYNATTYPIAVTNRGAITERWALVFTSTTAFQIIGENVGQIAIGNTSTPAAPTNPNTGVPYFTLDPAGWGAGWAAGNVLRFNSIGANFPLWIARTVLQGDGSGAGDEFRLQIRGNADA